MDLLKENFDKFMIKDYVKSVKGTKFPKYFDSTIQQEKFNEWMKVFYNQCHSVKHHFSGFLS